MRLTKTNEDLDDVYIFSIITSENDLKVAWLLNQNLNIHLSRTESIHNKMNLPEEGFAVFIYDNENVDVFCRYILIQNRRKNHSFFSSHPKIDYFFILMGAFFSEELEKIKHMLKGIDNFNAVIPVKPKEIKGYDMLFIFE